MPLYEYICDDTGETIELIRPMAQADDPVHDPERRGRVFKRKPSTFAAKSDTSRGSALPVAPGGCCPCGKPGGACNMN